MNLVPEGVYIYGQANAGCKCWAIVVSPFVFALVLAGATVSGGLTILREFRTGGFASGALAG
jgi:hypothetical protein